MAINLYNHTITLTYIQISHENIYIYKLLQSSNIQIIENSIKISMILRYMMGVSFIHMKNRAVLQVKNILHRKQRFTQFKWMKINHLQLFVLKKGILHLTEPQRRNEDLDERVIARGRV